MPVTKTYTCKAFTRQIATKLHSLPHLLPLPPPLSLQQAWSFVDFVVRLLRYCEVLREPFNFPFGRSFFFRIFQPLVQVINAIAGSNQHIHGILGVVVRNLVHRRFHTV